MNDFYERVQQLRATVEKKRTTTKLFAPGGRPHRTYSWDARNRILTIWYADNPWRVSGFRLHDRPGLRSGAILRFDDEPPLEPGFWEIDGECVHFLSQPPAEPELIDEEDDYEDFEDMLLHLPRVAVDPAVHFQKRARCRSEVCNLLACQGGCCTGASDIRPLVQLLGVDNSNRLVFPQYSTWHYFSKTLTSITAYKRCFLDIVSALEILHSHGITHRDLRLDNILVDTTTQRTLLCDLESRWGNLLAPELLAPELDKQPTLDAGWTPQSDIFDFGTAIQSLIYINNMAIPTLDWRVPDPFQELASSCLQRDPDRRPSLPVIRRMHESIPDDG